MSLAKHCIVEPGSKVRLKHRNPNDTFGQKRNDKKHVKTLARLRKLQHLLYADKRYSLLIVLQGLDASGKDGTIRHVMSGVNPQGCDVMSKSVWRDRYRYLVADLVVQALDSMRLKYPAPTVDISQVVLE